MNPAHVTEQRRVMGRRRVKTDALDLEAMTELLLAGRGVRSVDRAAGDRSSCTAWAAHRHRRVATRTATKNQLLGQLDRCFPGLTLALPDVLGTKVGRLVAEHFADPHRLAGLGASPVHPLRRRPRAAGPPPGRGAAGRRRPGRLAVPGRRGRPAGPGRGPGAAGRPGQPDAGRGDPDGGAGAGQPVRAAAAPSPAGVWCGSATTAPRSATRPAGPATGSSTAPPGCPRRSTSRPASAATARSAAKAASQLRRALIDLGIGLWLSDPAAKRYGQPLRARGKNGGIIACAMAHRANKIAYAMVRDQTGYDPTRWA